MKNMLTVTAAVIGLPALIILTSCNGGDKKTRQSKTDTVKPVRTNTEKNKEQAKVEKAAIINILDSVSPKRLVIYMKDSAKTFERISLKLGSIYGVKLAEVLKKNNIKMTGAPMAWYKTQKPPFFFEAGLAVNKKPAKLPKNVFVREMNTDSVIMAHFYGPYSLLGQGYDAIKERMKDQKKVSNGTPYEIYIDDPVDATGKPKDPYKIRTDIVFPIK
jgi:effector-binding domain-containing protein